ncbi:hypothetical protein [Limobrevibacterium gyesilva]|uniref:Uncharacterized protein n=1 Tax=Limobrevibacterium gyesilva TaxID=2991712 RepID=A0AA41YIW8_9PROT|nr:hypothetical protein [Limobrevibacterium gyesilva]MCW3473964.1 hypothetical protein [Limobrevibacterium gyesilva]
MDGLRLSWFLGVLAVEFWAAAWLMAFAPELLAWWQRRRERRRLMRARQSGARAAW